MPPLRRRRGGRRSGRRLPGVRDGASRVVLGAPGRLRLVPLRPVAAPELATNRSEPVLLITAAELDRAIPMRRRRAAPPRGRRSVTIGPDGRPRRAVGAAGRGPNRVKTSRLAIASLICAIAGIPLFGLVTGLVAVLLAVLALGGIQSGARRGLGLAVPGLLLGIVDVAGWAYLLSVVPWQAVVADKIFSDPPPDLAAIKELDPPLQRAMRANVLIERQHGLAILGGMAIGSGVILRIERGDALIVTNRHVVDPEFPADNDNSAGRLAGLGPPDGPHPRPARRRGPGRLDGPRPDRPGPGPRPGRRARRWPRPPPGSRGGPCGSARRVFAIGNPHHLGWTHTQGVISQFRTRTTTPAASGSSRPRRPSTPATAAAASTTRKATARHQHLDRRQEHLRGDRLRHRPGYPLRPGTAPLAGTAEKTAGVRPAGVVEGRRPGTDRAAVKEVIQDRELKQRK